jgi:hypothetical protein
MNTKYENVSMDKLSEIIKESQYYLTLAISLSSFK